jgi:molybdopterin/thiamine biosynthesis adenylyltransferase
MHHADVAPLNDEQLLRYSRHLLLNEWSEAHQCKLAASRVLVVGLGGLGSAVAPYLAASGIGTLLLADFDRVSLDNLQRQVLYRQTDVGAHKAEAAAYTLRGLNPDIHIEAYTERWNEADLIKQLQSVDLVVDCTDNFSTRYVLNRVCYAHHIPLVSGAAVEWQGRLVSFDFRKANEPCYHCIFPDGDDVVERRCATTGIFAPLVGVIGALQASEVLKLLLMIGVPYTNRLLSTDSKTGDWRVSRFGRDLTCPVCAKSS